MGEVQAAKTTLTKPSLSDLEWEAPECFSQYGHGRF